MNRILKRVLSLFLILLLCTAVLPAASFAEAAVSDLTVEQMFASYPEQLYSEEPDYEAPENRCINAYYAAFEGIVGRRDIDGDGEEDQIVRFLGKDGRGYYVVMLAGGSSQVLSISDAIPACHDEIYFGDLNADGIEDIAVSLVDVSTGSREVSSFAVYLSSSASETGYEEAVIVEPELKMKESEDGGVEILCTDPEYSEIQTIGTERADSHFNYWYGYNVDSEGYVIRAYTTISEHGAEKYNFTTAPRNREVKIADGSLLIYYDFGRQFHSEVCIQPFGAKYEYSAENSGMQLTEVGTPVIEAYWLK